MSTDRDIVTAHAMVRWLERFEGRDLTVMRGAFERTRGRVPDDGELLQFLSAYTGERLGDIRARIVTPALRTAIALGASKVRRGRVWLVITGGCVVTVLYRRRAVFFGASGADKHPRRGRWHSSKGRQHRAGWHWATEGASKDEGELCSV